MIGFIVAGLILTVSVGAFSALILTMKLEGKTRIIIAVILAFVIGFGLLKILMLNAEKENEKWNNGICTECGGEYKFKNGNNGVYYYACEDCDHVIKMAKLKK